MEECVCVCVHATYEESTTQSVHTGYDSMQAAFQLYSYVLKISVPRLRHRIFLSFVRCGAFLKCVRSMCGSLNETESKFKPTKKHNKQINATFYFIEYTMSSVFLLLQQNDRSSSTSHIQSINANQAQAKKNIHISV